MLESTHQSPLTIALHYLPEWLFETPGLSPLGLGGLSEVSEMGFAPVSFPVVWLTGTSGFYPLGLGGLLVGSGMGIG